MDIVPGGYNGYSVSSTVLSSDHYSCKSDKQKEKEQLEIETKKELTKLEELKQKIRNSL